jgi:hypothetical protein
LLEAQEQISSFILANFSGRIHAADR